MDGEASMVIAREEVRPVKMLDVEYTSVVDAVSVKRVRSFWVADEVSKDLYGYEIDDGTEGERVYLEKMQDAVNVLEELEGNTPSSIQSVG